MNLYDAVLRLTEEQSDVSRRLAEMSTYLRARILTIFKLYTGKPIGCVQMVKVWQGPQAVQGHVTVIFESDTYEPPPFGHTLHEIAPRWWCKAITIPKDWLNPVLSREDLATLMFHTSQGKTNGE